VTRSSRARLPLADLGPGRRVLPEEASRYLCRVLRLGRGDVVVVFDPSTRLEAEASIEVASAEAAVVEIGPPAAAPVVARVELTLVYALAKGDKVDAVVRDATELGASRIILAETERSVVKVVKADAKRERWMRIAEQAARQSGRGDVPEIAGPIPWADALTAAERCEARFCLDPRGATALGSALPSAVARGAALAFAIGPEGGLTPAEIELAAAKGFVPASLGAFVLRTETVAAAVLGAVRVMQTVP
jgi:16S rRNA (uracil1498-N3)-methyltransferase